MAMNMGADDYVTKPFSLPILDAKLGAFLRRSKEFAPSALVYDDFRLHLEGILENDKTKAQVQLTPTETRILALLFDKKERVVSKEQLLDHLWQGEDFIDQNTLHVNLTRLRKKTTAIGFDKIHTVRGVGYLLK